jgi:Flp pilus assembly protein TadG
MQGWTKRVCARGAQLLRDREGGVAVLTAMSLTSLLGFAGLGTEATLWYVAKRNMQGASDAAAFTAKTASIAGQGSTQFTAAAKAVAAQYGYVDGNNGIVVAVNNPPLNGAFAGNASAIEVVITQPQQMLFSRLFLSSGVSVSARAVANSTGGGGGAAGNGCVLTLQTGNVTDLINTGTAALNISTCDIYVNSSSSSALTLTGSSQINARSAYISGNYTRSGSAQFNASQGINTGVNPIADPYANVQVPSYSGCNRNNTSLVSQTTLNVDASTTGGVYVFCNGLTMAGQSTLNLAPGIYVIDRGSLTVSGGSAINAPSGVTIILTSSTGSGYGTVTIAGGNTLDISAPTTGPTAGLALFQDRHAPSTSSNSLTGGTSQTIQGAVYFPNEPITYSGGTGNTPATCTQLVALRATFVGNSQLNSNCSGSGVASIGGGGGGGGTVAALVE